MSGRSPYSTTMEPISRQARFSIRFLLAVTTAFSVWCATLQFFPGQAVFVALSLPAVLVARAWRRRRGRPSRLFLAAAVPAFVCFYVGSVGPTCGLLGFAADLDLLGFESSASNFVEWVYTPLILLCDLSVSCERFFMWYAFTWHEGFLSTEVILEHLIS